jgi:hypothetical protein
MRGKMETSPDAEATKEELQRRMEAARESISETVGHIRETVEGQYASVKAGVSGLIDWREGFRNDPIITSVGVLSAGFALGYTLGVAQKTRSRRGGKSPALAMFADGLIDEVKKAGERLPLLALNPQVRALFGFDLSEVLAEIGGAKRPSRRNPPAKSKSKRARRSRPRPSGKPARPR